MIYCAF